ncbi:MAG: PEP-CTERM sorting domain-containing protein [Cyanobacteria bacterium J06639_14]
MSPVALAACVLGSAGSAQAMQLFATDVVYYDNNGTSMSGYREDTSNALGSPELMADSSNGYTGNKDFLSLGLGGRAVFDFGQDFAGDVTLWETTWGYKSSQSSYDERVDIYYGNFDDVTDWDALANDLSQWSYAGDIFNVDDNAYNTAAGATNSGDAPEGVFNYVLLLDKSVTQGDGFDVNAISVQGVESQDVPEPVSLIGLLLVGTVGGSQLLRRQVV